MRRQQADWLWRRFRKNGSSLRGKNPTDTGLHWVNGSQDSVGRCFLALQNNVLRTWAIAFCAVSSFPGTRWPPREGEVVPSVLALAKAPENLPAGICPPRSLPSPAPMFDSAAAARKNNCWKTPSKTQMLRRIRRNVVQVGVRDGAFVGRESKVIPTANTQTSHAK